MEAWKDLIKILYNPVKALKGLSEFDLKEFL